MAYIDRPRKPTPILEVTTYGDEDNIIHRDGKNGSFVIPVGEDTWIFPWKATSVYTGFEIRIPDGTMALITGCPWVLEDKIHVHPQLLPDGSYIYPIVNKMGLLPRKLRKGEHIALLTLVSTTECELVQYHEDSLD